MKLIDKEKVVDEINGILNSYDPNEITSGRYELVKLREFLDTLEVKEIEAAKTPKHSCFETIYHCGAEPLWKVGDILATYECYSDSEGEDVYGEVIGVKKDETHDDWIYTMKGDFGAYEDICEEELISYEAYKKNK